MPCPFFQMLTINELVHLEFVAVVVIHYEHPKLKLIRDLKLWLRFSAFNSDLVRHNGFMDSEVTTIQEPLLAHSEARERSTW